MPKNVVIIGAGYTGLSAAYELSKQGVNVTILEASDTIGGLASDFEVEGSSLERAYHHIFKTDTSIIGLANKLGVGKKIIWNDSSVSIYYKNKVYPFKGALDLLRFTPLSFINRLRAGLVVLYLQKKKRWEDFEKITAYEWMLKYAGKQVTAVIWEPLLKGKFSHNYNKVSMAWLWARIHIRAQSREAGGEKLGYFDGGFQVFTDSLVNACIKNGVIIKKNQKITSILSDNSGIKITFEGNKTLRFDSCIATVPSYVFAKLIAASPKKDTEFEKYVEKLNSIDYLGARLLIFSSPQKISDYYWHNINDIKLPFLVFINHTKLIDKKNYNNQYIYYIAAYLPHDDKLFNASNSELQKIWFTSLKTIFPNFNEKEVREKHFFSFKNAQHIVDTNYSSHIPPTKTPLKNVYLSNFSQIYPEDRGTNFAVKAGVELANNIIKGD